MEIRRDTCLNKLISKRHNGLIKVITGVRRCGKSYMLFPTGCSRKKDLWSIRAADSKNHHPDYAGLTIKEGRYFCRSTCLLYWMVICGPDALQMWYFIRLAGSNLCRRKNMHSKNVVRLSILVSHRHYFIFDNDGRNAVITSSRNWNGTRKTICEGRRTKTEKLIDIWAKGRYTMLNRLSS